MTDTFRALCAELLEALEIQLDELAPNNRLCKRARTALAQPEPAGPVPVAERLPGACFAITQGEYSDYKVLAVFTEREMAEAELPKYGTPLYQAEIEEFPLNPVAPTPPAGMTCFYCSEDPGGNAYAMSAASYEMIGEGSLVGSVPFFNGKVRYSVHVWARNRDHAIKIAAEKFARQRAIDAGIAS